MNNSNKTFVNNYFAKFMLQEMVHNFRKGGKFLDYQIDEAALRFYETIDPKMAAKAKKDNQTSGSIAHHLVTDNCQYSQKEIDSDGQPPR